MMNLYLFYWMLFGLASIYLALGLWAARSVRTIQNYFLANRNLGVFQLTFALIASQLGSGMILGTAYRAYFTGFWGMFYTIGMSLGFIILGCGFASRLRALNIATTAEIFETHYGSSRLKMIASVLSVISLLGILVAQIVASRTLFVGLQITDPYIFLASWIFVIAYAMLGGLHAIVIVDIAQVSFIIAIFVAACTWAIPVKIVKYLTPAKLTMIQHYFFGKSMTYTMFLPILLIPTLFSLIEQDLAQKFFAAKTKATATISAFLAALFLILFSCIPIYFGLMAKIKHIRIPEGANPLVLALAKLCPQWIFVLAICAIFAAIISTANSLLCAISSNIVQDFTSYLHFEHKKLWVTKVISCCVGIGALVASSFISGDIISILEESYRLSVICLFVPTFIAYISKPTNSIPAWSSLLCGLAGYIAFHFSSLTTVSKDISALLLSLLGYASAYLLFGNKK